MGTQQSDILGRLLPYGIGVLVAAMILLWAAKQFLGEHIKNLAGRQRAARFTRRQIARYRRSITDDFQAHRMGFTGEAVIDINQVYVPLQSERNGERKDLYESIRTQPRSVVIGPAGAGKSLLLKNSMLMWAREPTRRIPVMVELHRCNGSDAELIDLVSAEIGRCLTHRRRSAERDRALARKALETGRLSLLFDGLDEVGRDDHGRVVRALEDFARLYRDCQIIVTCRDVVYRGQLAAHFPHLVRVAEFDDAGILRLLGNWPEIGGTPVVAEIFGTLRKNPALMRLARSPLLLTMIAYLHVEVFSKTGRTLPTSRSAFYDRAISHLLGRDADLDRSGSLTVFDVGEKRAVLQRAALTMQESTREHTDRRTIAETTLRSLTQDLLPDLNLDREHIKPLLGEIVDRSQLLVPLDKGRSRFTFRHTTLQEYLAAAELADDPERLLASYRADPLAWRETVKLWCGSSTRDCTKVVQEIFSAPEPHHKILALECLSEARRIDSAFADLIVDYFLTQLVEPGPDHAAITVAFGAVAADSRPRGRQVLLKLQHIARQGNELAMQALSASGRLEAAEALAAMAKDNVKARNALRGMGELAVPVLAARAADDLAWAAVDLGVVGTPSAAKALSELLWISDGLIATRAAWCLADLMRIPDVEHILRTEAHVGTSITLDWVWKPFADNKNDRMAKVAGRIAYLLAVSPPQDIPSEIDEIDPRIGIPLAVNGCAYEWRKIDLSLETLAEISELVGELEPRRRVGTRTLVSQMQSALRAAAEVPTPSATMVRLRDIIVTSSEMDPALERMLSMLKWPVEAKLLAELVTMRFDRSGRRDPEVRQNDWSTVLAAKRDPHWLWMFFGGTTIAFGAGLMIVAVIRAVMTIAGTDPFGPAWLSYVLLAGGIYVGSVFTFGDIGSGVAFVLSGLALVALVFQALVFGVATLVAWLPWPVLVALLGLLGVSVLLGLLAERWDRVNDNVFRQCWEAESMRPSGRTSVIAT